MIGLVVDASVTVAWCFEDEEVDYARRLLARSNELILFAPAIWPTEVTNVLLVNERKNRITRADTVRFSALLRELGIQIDYPPVTQSFDKTLSIAREYNLSAYDASYLELSSRKQFPLATLDKRLSKAALSLGLMLVDP